MMILQPVRLTHEEIEDPWLLGAYDFLEIEIILS